MEIERDIRITCSGAGTLAYKDLEPFQGELKSLSKENYAKLKKEILELGFSEPISVWQPGETKAKILNGHQRLRVISHMIEKEGYRCPDLPVNFVEAKSEKEAKRKVLALTSQYGTIEAQGLYEFMNEAEIGFDELKESFRFPEINFADFGREFFETDIEEDEVPSVPLHPVTQEGDLWSLGDHWLYCGDPRQESAAKKAPIVHFMMVTDPPYGVSYDPEWREKVLGNGNRSTGIVINDDSTDWTDTFRWFLGDVAYVWHGGKYSHETAQHLSNAGFDIRAQIIWRKQAFVISRGQYHWAHEPCWYAVRKGKKSHWCGDRKQSTVWDIKNASSNGENQEEQKGHGTQKPIECMARPIRNHGKKGDWIYDPFAGTGTTLIACEHVERKCYSIEISPGYCDVIIERWKTLTGREARKA